MRSAATTEQAAPAALLMAARSRATVAAAMASASPASSAASTAHATLRPRAAQLAYSRGVESPLSPIGFKLQRGQMMTADATVDTGATVSVCPESFVDKFGWTGG